MKRINYTRGDIVNNHGISYISEMPFTIIYKVKRRIALFKCHCGKEFTSPIADVKSNKRKSCGCRKGNKPNVYIEGELVNGIKFIKTKGTTKYSQRAIFECPVCKNEWESSVNNIQTGHTKSCCGVHRGWSKTQYTNISKTAKLYKVRLYNEKESFIKIGITIQSIDRRFRHIPYNYEIIKIIEGDSGYIFDLENKTKRLFKKYKYLPLIKFKGDSECYTK